MNFSASLRVIGWLIRDTLRQSLAYGLFWILLVISGVSILVCLSAGIEGGATLSGGAAEFLPAADREAQDPTKLAASGVAVLGGHLTLAGGAVRIPLARDARRAVHLLELILAGGIADTLGFLVAMVWTAGFLPGFLESRSASVLLATRAPRWLLLVGKYLGVLAFVFVHATLFVVGTWFALGVRTGIWDACYLWSVPLLLLHFGIFFSVSVLLAVWTHSAVLCLFGSLSFWCLAWGINFGRHAALLAAQSAPEGSFSPQIGRLADLAYWLLPKPADLGALLFETVGADQDFARVLDYDALAAQGFSMPWAVGTSLLFGLAILWAATRSFAAADY